MKHILKLVLLLAAASNLHADGPLEREFNQLNDERDKAIAAATDPIERKYLTSLEQLLRRATQANDLQTALKAREAMALSPITDAPSIKGTKWTWITVLNTSKIVFNPDGKFLNEQWPNFNGRWAQNGNKVQLRYEIQGKNTIIDLNFDKFKKTFVGKDPSGAVTMAAIK